MCNLPTLHFKRIRGDMIEVFKILTGKYDTEAAPVMDIYDLKTTRGNDFELNKIRAKYDLRQGCTTYGPRAACGPPRPRMWPASPAVE